MLKRGQIVTIIGGSGFLGSYVAYELSKLKLRINIVSRNASQKHLAKVSADVGQIAYIDCNVFDEKKLEGIIGKSDYIINLVGILSERGGKSFDKYHRCVPEFVAKVCAKSKIEKFVHVSALGVDNALSSAYAKSKLAGEQAVKSIFPNAYILRPSVIFGPEDNFINMFAKLIKYSPVVGLFNKGATKFQPVYVGDVAKAIAKIIANSLKSGTYELGGPKQYTMKELFQFIMHETKHKRCTINISDFFANSIALAMKALPVEIITLDQLKLLKYDNIITNDNGFHALGINELSSLEAIVPRYLIK